MVRSGFVVLAGLALGAMASSSLADGVVTMSNPAAGWRIPNNQFSGGAFRLTRVSGYNGVVGGPGGSSTSFLSFCVEFNENISLNGGQQYNSHISTSAYLGGVGGGGGPNGDPLDSRTAALYREFRGANTFGGANSVSALLNNNGVSADSNGTETRALQRAIWFIEQEIGDPSNGITAADFQNDNLALAFYNWANHSSHNTGSIGDVRVLRLWVRNANGSDGNRAQDQLTIIPIPPAAWAGLVSLAGLAGLGRIRRRMHQA